MVGFEPTCAEDYLLSVFPFRIPHFAFPIPHSAFRIPRGSASEVGHCVVFPSPPVFDFELNMIKKIVYPIDYQ